MTIAPQRDECDYIDAVLDGYAEWLQSENRGSLKTVEIRRWFLRDRIDEWGIDGFTVPNIRTFLASPNLDGSPKSPWTKATYHGHLKSFTRWAHYAEVIGEYPFSNPEVLRRPRVHKDVPRPISNDERDRLLRVANQRERAWMLLAMLAGLRAHEIAKIKGQDVQRDYVWLEGKGGKRAGIPTNPALWDLAADFPRTGYWFPSPRSKTGHIGPGALSTRVGKLFVSQGVDGSIHRCRHYFGTTLVTEGVDLRTVQTLMRHASLATTETYTLVADSSLRTAIDRLIIPPPEEDTP